MSILRQFEHDGTMAAVNQLTTPELLLETEKFSFPERCQHSNTLGLECVPRRSNPTSWSAKKMGCRVQIFGKSSILHLFSQRLSKPIRRLRTPMSPIVKKFI